MLEAMPRDARFEIFEHTADVGFRAWGATVEECFLNAGRAFVSIASDPGPVEPRDSLWMEAEGEDYADLLVNWLNEALYRFDTGRFAFHDFVEAETLTQQRLVIHASGEAPRDPARHPWKLIVKAVTYHDLEVTQRNGRWEARVILDV